MKHQLAVFDGDDTLWFVEPLYDEAKEAAGEIVAAAGLSVIEWQHIQRQIDLELVQYFGMSCERFPESCVEAYRRLADSLSIAIDRVTELRVREAARSVFHKTAQPAREVVELLQQLNTRFHLALLTKGEEWVQRKRIADVGISAIFDHVSVVSEKDSRQFTDLLAVANISSSSAWSIGNSLASDINPALRIGMRAIWIDAPVWEYERRELQIEDGEVIAVSDLSEAVHALLRADERNLP